MFSTIFTQQLRTNKDRNKTSTVFVIRVREIGVSARFPPRLKLQRTRTAESSRAQTVQSSCKARCVRTSASVEH
ncbi:hypothetical protein B5X24_HaOG214460 [Helicoverpa armigera]|nr:hypothetical protein B5X24_HaOG214460 [Helicoverpa armigera]